MKIGMSNDLADALTDKIKLGIAMDFMNSDNPALQELGKKMANDIRDKGIGKQ